MAKAHCRAFRTDVKAAWKLLTDLGLKCVSVKYNFDGSFRIITEEYVKAKYGEPSKLNTNPWDEVLPHGAN